MARKKRQASNSANPTGFSNRLIMLISAGTAVVYFFSNPKFQTYYDYTFRVAENLLHGSIGFVEKPPPWLNEFVPVDGYWYSVFPFGAIVSMLPFAVLKSIGIITQMPSALIAALCAAASCLFMLSSRSIIEFTARDRS